MRNSRVYIETNDDWGSGNKKYESAESRIDHIYEKGFDKNSKKRHICLQCGFLCWKQIGEIILYTLPYVFLFVIIFLAFTFLYKLREADLKKYNDYMCSIYGYQGDCRTPLPESESVNENP